MYDGRSLQRVMSGVGFIDCQIKGLHETRIPHIEKVEMPHRVLDGQGVIVEGLKPLA